MRSVKDKNGRLSAQETLALWQAYKESGDPRLRDRLVLTFAPMVKYIVYRKVREIPARCEVEDFISCGLEALIRSIDRYDPEKGATLEQFAWTRIHGAVLDELRRNDWAPRSLRRWDRDITKAREHFIGLYGRPPTEPSWATSLGVSPRSSPPPGRDRPRRTSARSTPLVLSDDDTTIERIDTLPSEDRDSDPECIGHARRGQGALPRGL